MDIDPIKYVETALSLDRRAAKFIFFGFLLLVLSAYLVSQIQDVNLPVFAMPVALLVFCVVIASLARMSGRLKTLLSWALILLFLAWLTAFVLQAVTGSRLTPPLATASCMMSPWEERCQITQQSAALAETTPAAELVRALPGLAPSGPPAGLTNNRVLVQFAGLVREDVVAMSTALVAQGWKVEGADRGGERLAAAAGLMEVRYFHAADAPGATALASAVTAAREAFPAVGIRDFSQTPLAAQVPAGQFEIWISR
jgi:hypothetical protein